MTTPMIGRRIVVAHDLDGCHFDFVGAFCARMARVDPANADLYMSQSWPDRRDFYKNFGWSTPRFLTEYADAMEEGLLADAAFTHDGTVESAHRIKRELGDRVESIVATDRSVGAPGAGEEQSHAWIDAVNFPADRVLITADKREAGADFFIEDTIGNYQELRAAGVQAFLIRRPWNESANVPAEHYVDTMDEFAQTVIDEVRSGRFDETPVLGGLAGRRTSGAQGRVLRGVPAGGQFAAAARAEASVSL